MTKGHKDRNPGAGLGLILLGLGAVAFFVWLEIQGGFPNLREYGFPFLKRLPAGEASFYVKYLALILPAGLLLGSGIAFLLGRRPFESLGASIEAPSDRAFLTMVSVTGAVLVLAAGLWVLRDQPVTDDERVYLFQAEILSRGRLYELPYPGVPEFFNNTFIINRDKWYGKYPPGHPLALVPGIAAGFPRAVPALLAALNLFLFYQIALHFFSRRSARCATLLLLASPFFLLTGGTLLSHMTCLAALQVFGLFALKARNSASAGDALIAGAGLGFAFLTRPYTAVLIGAPIMILWAWQAVRSRSPLRPWIAAMGAGSFFLGAFLGYNAVLTGNPFQTGYSEVQPESGRVLGFGEILPGKISHTPLDGLINIGMIAVRLNFWTWGWPLGWIFVIAALLWARDSRLTPLWATLIAVAAGSVFYFSIGVSDTGPVKYYELLPILTILTVAGVAALDRRVASGQRPGVSALAPALVICFCFLGWGLFGRIQIGELRQLTDRIAAPYRLVEKEADRKLLVFVGTLQKPPFDSWVHSAPNNVPDHEMRVVYATDQGALKDRELMDRMPERTPFLLQVDDAKQYTLTRLSGDEATKRLAESYIQEGILLLRELKVAESIQKFAQAIKTDPGYGRSYLLLGWALEQARRQEDAERAYKKALELEPHQAEWYFFYGRLLGRMGRFKEAEAMLLRTNASAEAQRIMEMVRRQQIVP